MVQVGLEDVTPQHKVGEFALSNDGNESCRLELLDMMRKRGRADRLTIVHVRAGHRAACCANLLENFVAARIG